MSQQYIRIEPDDVASAGKQISEDADIALSSIAGKFSELAVCKANNPGFSSAVAASDYGDMINLELRSLISKLREQGEKIVDNAKLIKKSDASWLTR